jgi:hypothetical protein
MIASVEASRRADYKRRILERGHATAVTAVWLAC